MTIQDTPGLSLVKLNSSSGSPEVSIEFDCRDSSADENTFTDEEMQDDDGNELMGEGPVVAFTADVSKSNTILRFHCTASEVVNIDSIEYLPTGTDEEAAYSGPEFDELDESLKDAFHEYLEDLGVNESLAGFIAMYSDHEEQKEYIKWLQDVQTFTSLSLGGSVRSRREDSFQYSSA
eukprot:FR734766.1.p1 GENE.FR734766.1~~FR734766.1.p1  ORF type:complete len:178 (+),score=20.99 FR734766.1:259-792(+)